MVIYVWQCMVVLLYDCICARWLWSIMNEHAPLCGGIYIYIYIYIRYAKPYDGIAL